jgi:hypothetical protein
MIWDSIPTTGTGFCSSPKHPDQHAIQWLSGVLSLGVVWLGYAVTLSTPCNAEVRNKWGYTPLSPYTLMAWAGPTLTLPATCPSINYLQWKITRKKYLK